LSGNKAEEVAMIDRNANPLANVLRSSVAFR
jgi:hypothetical protein